jgi:hypothetical protein
MADDYADLRFMASQCVDLVHQKFGLDLDWQLDSLAILDDVCERLRSDGPLVGERLVLWWKLVGAYTGEVAIRAYGGTWIAHEKSPGAPAIRVDTITGFPFGIADRVLNGEPYKSLASFARSLPAIIEHGRSQQGPPQDG